MAFFSRIYRPVLLWSLRSRALVAGGAIVILALAGILASRLGSEFIPQLDEGDAIVQPIRLRTVGEKETVRLVTAMEKTLLTVPEVRTIFTRSGTAEVATDPMPLSASDGYVMLKPRKDWRKGMTKAKLIEEMEEKLKDVPGQGYGFSQPIQLRFDELTSGVKANIGIKVFGEDLDELKTKADQIAATIQTVPGAADVTPPALDSIPILQITLNRDTLARVGVNISDAQEWVGTALAGRAVGQIIEGDKRFDLTVRLPEADRTDVEALRALPITTPNGGTVRLDSVASIRMTGAPPQVTREQGKRFAVVLANVRGRDLGSFVTEAQAKIKRDVKLPTGYYLEWSGQFENLERATARLALVVPLALGLIFALLFLSFGNLKQSLLIFTGVPLAVTGGVFGLVLRGLPLSISAGIGFIALSGVAVLNGVVMVSAINALRAEGRTVREAVWEGANSRLRPVLMTALVAAIGFIPMALNTGIGAEVQRPLATVVIGGIVSSTILTLVVLPMLYAWFIKEETHEVDVAASAPAH
jgi:heavy metal efflux system protein